MFELREFYVVEYCSCVILRIFFLIYLQVKKVVDDVVNVVNEVKIKVEKLRFVKRDRLQVNVNQS